jgi:hypothetical protein
MPNTIYICHRLFPALASRVPLSFTAIIIHRHHHLLQLL